MDKQPRIAIVTGANRGIGFAAAEMLARKGFTVVMTARDARNGQSAHAELAKAGLPVVLRRLDLAGARDTEALASWLREEYGRVHVLINNAGMMSESRRADAESSPDSLRGAMTTVLEHFKVNTLGAVRLIQVLAPLMPKDARIINVSSELGQLSDMGGGHLGYRVSKTALNAASRVLASDLRPRGIKVYAMSPGWVRTRMGGKAAPRSAEEGADTAVWLATTQPAPDTAYFYKDRKPIPW